MKIQRDTEEIKIIFESNINKKKYETQTKGTQYQYTVTLPAPIVKLFKLEELKDTQADNWGNCLDFYEYENKIYLIPSFNVWHMNIKEEMKDIMLMAGSWSHPYQLKNGVYKIGLSKRYFNKFINQGTEHKIVYTVHTGQTDINNRPGLVEVEILPTQ